MANSVLIKTDLKGSIADSFIGSLNNKTNRYYYFLGRTQPWDYDYQPFTANDSYHNELVTRQDLIYAKQIQSTDVSLVVKRIDWKTNTIFDRYDDEYSTELVGINLISGGANYTSAPTVVINGTGTGAAATATVSTVTGRITSVTVTSRGTGYLNSLTNPPTITFTGGGGSGATASAVLVNAQGNVTRLEDSQFYVLTDDYNVYVCLDNNNNAPSTVKPYGTSSTPIILNDGYKWKYLFTLPLALRAKFLTTAYMPVATSLRAQFYASGAIRNVQIGSPGTNYGTGGAYISASGDGYLASDPYYVTALSLGLPNNGGAGYSTAVVNIDPPFGGSLASTAWVTGRVYIFGQYVSNNGNIYIIDVGGVSNATPPTHTTGSVTNGPTYRYIGTAATAQATLVSGSVTALTLNQGVRGVNIVNGGSGYANGPNAVTFSSGTATAVAYAQNGVIYRIDITNRSLNNYTTLPTITSIAGGGTGFVGTVLGQSGAGYSSAPNVTVTGTGTITSPASVTATMIKSEARIFPVISGGGIVSVQIVDGGVGYTSVDLNVTSSSGTGAKLTADLLPGDATTLQSNTELTAVDGAIYTIPVTSGGYGYTTIPNVIIRGEGSGAAATASISNGAVTSVTVTNPGAGYKSVKIEFSGGGGSGAAARAIISPYGGHSSNVVKGLLTRSLMFYSEISKDQVNGNYLGADYRQFGILRNPYVYGSPSFTTANIITACWTITPTTSIPVAVVADSILTTVPTIGGINASVTAVTSGTVYTLNSVAGINVGMSLTGPGVVDGTTVVSINNLTVTVSTPIAGLTTGAAHRYNYIARFRVVYASTSTVLSQSMDNIVPSVGDLFSLSGNSFTAATITPPSFDKYSGDLLYQDNQVPFQPQDSSSEKITISTIFKF
jgi:hypothetical protein